MKIKNYLILFALISFCGCATISNEARYYINKPINCASAAQDIAALEQEKASPLKRARCAAQVSRPYSAASSALKGDLRNKVQVASGKYNRKINAKINQIKNQCY